MTEPKSDDREIVLTRSFAAPPAAVFAALTQPEQLKQWFASTGFTLVACEVDLRVGGSARHVFQRASGRRIEVRDAYETVDAPRTLAYRETYDFSPLEVAVRTVLTANGAGTALRQVLTYRSRAERDADAPGVQASSREAFDRLDRHLAAPRR